ncbi:hypothetical protein [Paractinoplanes ovalisporus]|uniref:hypothetical protein n=1 Tax=Paractinoplanes ovalisporus TaxID=2810368 RepID=UPI001F40C63C|nr:hypothetical protein [Actinoplanes ovalisporus]
MQRLELVVVQLDEVRRLIEVGRIPQLRLAYILLDSAVELLMHRMVQWKLRDERRQFEQLERLYQWRHWRTHGTPIQKQLAEQITEQQLHDEIAAYEPRVTPNKYRREVDRYFGAKVAFLVEKGALPTLLKPVLGKLHDYRNETYHRDQHREQVLIPAVLVYFDVACAVLEQLRSGAMTISGQVGPEMARFIDGDPHQADPFEIPARVAAGLRAEVGLDVAAVAQALTGHVAARLEELESGLEYIEQNSRSARPGDAIAMMQAEDGDLEAVFSVEVLRRRTYPLSMADVHNWQRRAELLAGMGDRDSLFAAFAELEDAFEGLERRVARAVRCIDEEANMRI